MDFTLEALRRYLVLQFIESTQMKNTMSEVNQNAIETAKAMKEIQTMFGMKNQPQSPIQNPFQQQQQTQNPFASTPSPDVFSQQQNYQMQQYQQAVNMMTEMQKQFVELQKQIFDGLHGLYNLMTDLVNELKDRKEKTQQQ